MTLIKIDKERYINSDHVIYIDTPRANPNTDEVTVKIYLIDKLHVTVPPSVASYITQTLDTNDAFTDEQPPTLSLISQLAQHLRNRADGHTFSELLEFFPNDNNALITALADLVASNTITIQYIDNTPRYYHATNSVFAHLYEPEEW